MLEKDEQVEQVSTVRWGGWKNLGSLDEFIVFYCQILIRMNLENV